VLKLEKETINRKLSINCLSDNMIKCAIEKGYRIPVVSIKHHYNKAGTFIENYINNTIQSYELRVYNKNKCEAIYLMEV
jgi:hypothetical protein